MLPSFEYEKVRIQARFHVQVKLESVPDSESTPGDVRVGARVVRVFRGAPDLRVGDVVEFAVRVCRQHDDLPFGGTRWTNLDALLGAHFMEVYLNGDPPNCSVPMSQCKIIEAPGDTAAIPCRPAQSLDELVSVLADGCFRGRSVCVRICNCPDEVSALRFENVLQSMDAEPLEHRSTSANDGAGDYRFRIGEDMVTVYRDANAIDIEGPSAAVLRIMYSICGFPLVKDTGAIRWRQGGSEPEHVMNPVDPLETSLSYAAKLAGAGEDDGALFMLDLAIPDLERLTSIEERHDQVATLATALVTKGTVISRRGDDTTPQPLFQRANEIMASACKGGRGRNADLRWALEYVDRAKKEGRAGQYRSAGALFGQAVTLLEQLMNNEGRNELGPELAKALVGQANASMQIGWGEAASSLCDRAIAILEPLVKIQARRGLEPDLVRARDVKRLAGDHGLPSQEA